MDNMGRGSICLGVDCRVLPVVHRFLLLSTARHGLNPLPPVDEKTQGLAAAAIAAAAVVAQAAPATNTDVPAAAVVASEVAAWRCNATRVWSQPARHLIRPEQG